MLSPAVLFIRQLLGMARRLSYNKAQLCSLNCLLNIICWSHRKTIDCFPSTLLTTPLSMPVLNAVLYTEVNLLLLPAALNRFCSIISYDNQVIHIHITTATLTNSLNSYSGQIISTILKVNFVVRRIEPAVQSTRKGHFQLPNACSQNIWPALTDELHFFVHKLFCFALIE